jgi:hypothetical protein
MGNPQGFHCFSKCFGSKLWTVIASYNKAVIFLNIPFYHCIFDNPGGITSFGCKANMAINNGFIKDINNRYLKEKLFCSMNVSVFKVVLPVLVRTANSFFFSQFYWPVWFLFSL